MGFGGFVPPTGRIQTIVEKENKSDLVGQKVLNYYEQRF